MHSFVSTIMITPKSDPRKGTWVRDGRGMERGNKHESPTRRVSSGCMPVMLKDHLARAVARKNFAVAVCNSTPNGLREVAGVPVESAWRSGHARVGAMNHSRRRGLRLCEQPRLGPWASISRSATIIQNAMHEIPAVQPEYQRRGPASTLGASLIGSLHCRPLSRRDLHGHAGFRRKHKWRLRGRPHRQARKATG